MRFDTQSFLSLSLTQCAKIIPQDRIVPNFTQATRRNILRDDCKVFLSGRFLTRFVQVQPNKKT